MGAKGSQQTKEKKLADQRNPKPDIEYELPPRKQRPNQLQNPYDDRPIELSWLQQNNSNDNYNRSYHHHHDHHIHFDEHLRRIPLAINRWPKTNDEIKEQKSKSFIEEYIQQ